MPTYSYEQSFTLPENAKRDSLKAVPFRFLALRMIAEFSIVRENYTLLLDHSLHMRASEQASLENRSNFASLGLWLPTLLRLPASAASLFAKRALISCGNVQDVRRPWNGAPWITSFRRPCQLLLQLLRQRDRDPSGSR